MDDRFAASAGFVVAGVAAGAGLLDWTPGVARAGVASPVGVALAGVALVAFALRRHGVADRRAAVVAGAALAAQGLYAVVVLVEPAVGGVSTPTVGAGLPLAVALSPVGVAVAYADWTGLSREAVVDRTGAAGTALLVGVVGLLAGAVLEAVPLALVGDSLPAAWRFGLLTLSFGVGLVAVAVGFMLVTDRGLDYVDAAVPDRRDLAYAGGGVLVIFALLVGLGVLSSALGLGGAESSVVAEARETPEILLVLVPLSWLAIGTGEELLYRNVVQKYLAETYSAAGAVLLACGVFAVMHFPAYATAGSVEVFTTLVRLFVLSLVLGVAYERTRNLLVAVFIHGTFDAVQFAALYVSLTGGLV